MSGLSRRRFLRLAGLSTASLALFVGGCAKPVFEPGPGPTIEIVGPTMRPQSAATEPAPSDPTATIAPMAKVEPTRKPLFAKKPTGTPIPLPPTVVSEGDLPYMSVIHGDDAKTNAVTALASLGGMGRFVSSGDDVIIKPNICTDYYPAEYAATTNPDVVAVLVTLCLEAGAKRVRVMDTPFGGTPESAYGQSGIAGAVRAAGGKMEVMTPVKYQTVPIPDGLDLKEWSFYDDILTADVVINVPIAKHHSLARLTLGGKNLLGVIQSPGSMHRNIGQRVADLISRVRPTLTIIDAYRILTANGPTGGDLDDVALAKTIIASTDIVAADSWAATLFGLKGANISYIRAAAEMGLGTMDLDSITIDEQHL